MMGDIHLPEDIDIPTFRNAARALASPIHHAGDCLLIRRLTGALPRVEICLQRGAEVWARDDVAMRTGESVLNQRPCALRLKDA